MPPYSQKYLKRKNDGMYLTAVRKKARAVVRAYSGYASARTAPAPRRVELKYDYGVVNGTVSSTPSVTLLSTIANGTGSSDRIGKMIQFHDIEISWHLRMAAVHNSNRGRFWIVYDKSPNGVLPAYTDVLQSSDVNTTMNCDTRARFLVLYEANWVTTNETTGCSYSVGQVQGHKVVSLKGKKCTFIGTGAGIADIETGAIYIVTNSYDNNAVALEFTNKIQFSDA